MTAKMADMMMQIRATANKAMAAVPLLEARVIFAFHCAILKLKSKLKGSWFTRDIYVAEPPKRVDVA